MISQLLEEKMANIKFAIERGTKLAWNLIVRVCAFVARAFAEQAYRRAQKFAVPERKTFRISVPSYNCARPEAQYTSAASSLRSMRPVGPVRKGEFG